MSKILSSSSDGQSLFCSTIKDVISLSIEPPHNIEMNYFLEISPLSLENLQHIKFSSCVSSKMMCYSSYRLLCAWTKDRGSSQEPPSPLCSPFAHPSLPTHRKAPGKLCLCRGPPQSQHKWKTRAQWGHHHTSPTLGSPSPAASCSYCQPLFIPNHSPAPPSCPSYNKPTEQRPHGSGSSLP